MKKITLFFLLMIISVSSIFSQQITEGKEFWFGLPYCKTNKLEFALGMYPIEIWISSKYDTKATIKIKSTGFDKQFVVQNNKVTKVGINDRAMCKESEIAQDNGIHIKAEHPVTVYVYYAYQWTGEVFNVIPIDWLGKKYVSLNLYEDKTEELNPPQILIVASEDNTIVYYKPTKPTEKVSAGTKKEVKLNKGQTYLILGKEDNNLLRSPESDITGTYITSNKPIAVISGHTKGTTFGDVINPFNKEEQYRIRNVMLEQLLPIELLGTEYIPVAIRLNSLDPYHIRFYEGDLIRFIATQDSTIIYQMRLDGSGLKQITIPLKTGEYFDIRSKENVCYYKSNFPILVGQYSKGWSYYNKLFQGNLISLTPKERWGNFAIFDSPSEDKNYIDITLLYEDFENLYFDGINMKASGGFSAIKIPGTPYAYISERIDKGNHIIEGRNGAKFAAYAYGNMEEFLVNGFSYGYPVGINYAEACEDSIFIDDFVWEKKVKATAYSINTSLDTNCAGLYSIWAYPEEIYNYKFSVSEFNSGDSTASYELSVIDTTRNAYALINVMNRSGYRVSKSYSFTAQVVSPPVELISPKNKSVNLDTIVRLTWNETIRADGYHLQISKAENFFAKILDTALIYDTSYTVDLEMKTKHFWRVRGYNSAGYGEWSQIWNFTTYSNQSILIFPENKSTIKYDTINFIWYSHPIALAYTIQIAKDTVFQSDIYENIVSDTSFNIIREDLNSSFYYWRVKSNNSLNTGEWSEIWNFQTEFDKAVLIEPPNDTSNIPVEINFKWNMQSNTPKYRIQVSNQNNFLSIIIDTILSQNTYSKVLSYNKKYYWRVCAGDGDNFGEWSEVWSFTTGDFSDVKTNIKTNNSFSIFPNPADNELYIEFSNDFSNNCEIEIIDMQGNTVSSTKKSNLIYGMNKEQISLKDLPIGSYYCVLQIGGNRYSKMFVKM